jgi:hypothetical protein
LRLSLGKSPETSRLQPKETFLRGEMGRGVRTRQDHRARAHRAHRARAHDPKAWSKYGRPVERSAAAGDRGRACHFTEGLHDGFIVEGAGRRRSQSQPRRVLVRRVQDGWAAVALSRVG